MKVNPLAFVVGLYLAISSLVTSSFAGTFFTPETSVWKFRPGTNEASLPLTAWREKDFDDSSWSNASAPIYYSTSPTEPPFYEGGIFNGTKIEGMMDSYSSIFLRKEFT